MRIRGVSLRMVAVASISVGACASALAADRASDAVFAPSFGADGASLFAAAAAPLNTDSTWRIFKSEWSAADEDNYARFVQAIGWSDCTSLEDCLSDPANPYHSPEDADFTGDCADMAYTLRAYFAWKNGLPFSYQNAMRTANGKAEDVRYSTSGNVVAGRRHAIGKNPVSAHAFINRIPGEVSTAMFRTHPETGAGNSFDDFYPVAINRESVRPGVIAYDIYGHVGIVYDILDDGRALVIASHPDHSVTRTTYGPNFLRAKPALGAGLKAWRPIKLVGASERADGSLSGGKIIAADNEELADYSLEQYFGNEPDETGDWELGRFMIDGRSLNYYDYVRRRLAAPGFALDPVTELRNGLESLCGAIRDRKVAVDRATSMRVHLRDHPKRLPRNIYGTYGDWEEYSTPSRDARLKVSFIELRRSAERLVEQVREGDPTIKYEGDNLVSDLIDTFNEENNECRFTYWRSDGSRVRLNLGHVMDRLWDISFDPYHCPERRWGAKGAELASCTDGEEKTQWYNAQRFLRYQAERTYDVRMDFTLAELKAPAIAEAKDGGLGVEAPADANIRAYLYSLTEKPLIAEAENAMPDAGELLVSASAVEEEPRFPEWHYKILNHWGKPGDKPTAPDTATDIE